ncbi:Bcr/CflA family efflux MFS transporter [Bradyrhizobium sp. ISRA463]|uniref:Bcr/CflA family efflux MFS transporter n=1 Tax=unclassified Bradyrhizobium TaxID=2631580 RepID=UPI0032B08CFE
MRCLSLMKLLQARDMAPALTPINGNMAVRINPNSFAFTLLLGLLASLPTFGIDMILPSLSAAAADLGVTSADVGLAMSVYLMTMGASLLIYGPVSDRFGRKPIIMFGCALVVAASLGCLLSSSLSQLLVFRALQGAGASATGIAAVAIVNDLFEGETAAARMANVVLAIYVVPMIAPIVGAALLALGSWRTVYLVPLAAGLVLLAAMSAFSESATIDPNLKLGHATMLQNYRRVLRHPLCVGYILCNAAAAGAVFAYVTGSSLFFINALGLSPYQYGVIFAASSLSVMLGTRVNRILGRSGLSPAQVIVTGLALSTFLATSLVVVMLAEGTSASLVVIVIVGVALSFGLISPHTTNEAVRPMPEIVGTISAARAFVQMIGAALSSAMVAALFDGHSAFSMAAVMLGFCLLAFAIYVGLVLPAEHVVEAT